MGENRDGINWRDMKLDYGPYPDEPYDAYGKMALYPKCFGWEQTFNSLVHGDNEGAQKAIDSLSSWDRARFDHATQVMERRRADFVAEEYERHYGSSGRLARYRRAEKKFEDEHSMKRRSLAAKIQMFSQLKARLSATQSSNQVNSWVRAVERPRSVYGIFEHGSHK